MNRIFAGICYLFLMLLAANTQAQDRMDTLAIEEILRGEVSSWNSGDAIAYSKHFAENGTFTNILGMFFTGYKAFLDRHIEIFKGRFSNTKLTQSIVSFRFLRTDVAIVETFTVLTGFSKEGPPPGIQLDKQGQLRTRLLQVMTKGDKGWQIVVYHNTDLKAGINPNNQ